MKHPTSFPSIRSRSCAASGCRFLARVFRCGVILAVLAAGACGALAAGSAARGGGGAGEQDSPGLEGVLSLVWGDPGPESGGQPRMEAFVCPDGQPRVRLVWSEEGFDYGALYAANGKRVAVSGVLLVEPDRRSGSRQLYVDRLAAGDESVKRPSALTGPQPWVTIPVKFSDVADEPKTISFFQNMFGSSYPQMNHYWNEVSYGNISTDGSYVATRWYTLPYPRSHYITGSPEDADLDALFLDATAAADADIDYTQYVGINLFFNDDLDGYSWGGGKYATLDGESRVWRATWEAPWGYQHIAPLQHEMGHGFGLPHSCFSEAATYDNSWDVMSNSWQCDPSDATYGCVGQHTIAYHKDRLGWIPSGQKVTVATGTRQTVTLERLAQPSNANTKMIVVPIGGSATHYYTVEARKEVGYDGQLPGAAVIVHDVLTTRSIPAHVMGSDGDTGAMYTAGETYTDATNHITITVTSSTATGFSVEVNNNAPAGPTITDQPDSQTINSGQTATLSVTATGTGTLSYQWYRGSSGSTANPVGTNANTFTTPALTATTSYWVRVTDSNGTADSNTATVTICAAPSITAHPQSKTISSGQTTTLSVTATGTGTLSYQWYRGSSGSTTNPVGTNSSSFTTPALTATTPYWVRVTNGCGTADSNTATVTVTACAAPQITAQPQGTTIASGGTATLNVTAEGTATLSYQWYRGSSGSTTNPVGTNSSSFTTPALTTTTSYWVRVTNGCGTADSQTATVTVSSCAAPSITDQPDSQSISSGQTATLSVTASGTASLSYQWYRGSSGSTANPVGTNSSSFTTPALTVTKSYWVRVTNGCGTADSQTATVTVCSLPSISTHPQNGSINAGQTKTLSVVAGGSGPLTYQWYRGSAGSTANPVGTNASSYTTPPLLSTTYFWVRVGNGCGTTDSNAARVSVQCDADVNQDGVVNAQDLILLAWKLARCPAGEAIAEGEGDVNQDGKINALDLVVLGLIVIGVS